MERFSVKVVSVGGGLPSREFFGVRDYLKVFFSRYGIVCDVSYDETDYSDLELFDKGSGTVIVVSMVRKLKIMGIFN